MREVLGRSSEPCFHPHEAGLLVACAGSKLGGVDRVYVAVTEGSPIEWRRGSVSSVAGLWRGAGDLGALAWMIEEIDGISYDLA